MVSLINLPYTLAYATTVWLNSMFIASRALIALLAFCFSLSAFAENSVTITCQKIIEDENELEVSRLRLVLVAGGASEIALVEGAIKRGEDNEAIDLTERVFVKAAKCEAVNGQPLQFNCSVADQKSRVASLKGEGKVEGGEKTFTVTRVNRDSTIQLMKFAASECRAN
jgi:predicted HNH restriction endonuclease